jgi:hypothetical protein
MTTGRDVGTTTHCEATSDGTRRKLEMKSSDRWC